MHTYDIDLIDTAISYGDSEKIVGEACIKNFKVVSKLPPLPNKYLNLDAWVNENVNLSLKRLGIDSLYGLLIHKSDNFFGSEGTASHLHYYFDEDNKKDVHRGMLECDRHLGKYRKLLDEFFETREGYNDKMLVEYLDEKAHPTKHTEQKVKYYLEWYARLILGKKIYNCILEQGSCSFEAEL